MNTLHPWQLLPATLASSMKQQQQDEIGYIQDEHQILRNKLKGTVTRFTDDESRGLTSPVLYGRAPGSNRL